MMPVTPSGGLMVLLHGQVVRWPVLISGIPSAFASGAANKGRTLAVSIFQVISLTIRRTEKGSSCRQ
jgi:hypothetical protein